ncbi:MAG: RloB domain-containing protein [Magnetococcales bacterium]|nr:RloB domain-containing protein [Magnetococcales bacterium]
MTTKRRIPPPRALHTPPRPHPPRPDLIICCEGQNTEPHYLIGFAAQHGVVLRPHEHIISPCGVPKTVLQRALAEKKKKTKEHQNNHEMFKIWMVIDVDEHAHEIPDILTRAKNAGIQVALSNPCIEIWALYHFDPPPTGELHRHVAQSRLKQRMPKYDKDKGKLFDLELMTPNYELAIKHAQSAMQRAEQEEMPHPNPSSNLYKLLECICKMGRKTPTAPCKKRS